MVDEWHEIVSVPLPETLSDLPDDEMEHLRQFIESECQAAFVRFMDGEESA